ncbi:hypothetical protein [Bacillus sp. B15-48]|uniref:hypothetical protein n=1 Tax=Bacillus sp. B15-48 TaxID=1548601 RepID=UPI00193EEF4C|nr:hypothetical protein [Bacillus sp. B15-48]MBM4763749.1 hypothetical protein [Bacillus sp. B15-48]
MIFIFTISFISACGESAEDNGEYPYGHYEDDKMIGSVSEVNNSGSTIVVDISEWEKRDRKGPGMTDEGYSYEAKITDKTVIKYEEDNETSIDDIKKGQKVLVNPPRGDGFEGHPDEIILIEMTYEEKYSRLLSHTDGMNIVIMYKDGETLPMEMQETVYENVMNILEGTEHRASAAWVPYDEKFIVDYQEELDIEQFPAMLVFDGKELIFKGYSVDELYDSFRNLIE